MACLNAWPIFSYFSRVTFMLKFEKMTPKMAKSLLCSSFISRKPLQIQKICCKNQRVKGIWLFGSCRISSAIMDRTNKIRQCSSRLGYFLNSFDNLTKWLMILLMRSGTSNKLLAHPFENILSSRCSEVSNSMSWALFMQLKMREVNQSIFAASSVSISSSQSELRLRRCWLECYQGMRVRYELVILGVVKVFNKEYLQLQMILNYYLIYITCFLLYARPKLQEYLWNTGKKQKQLKNKGIGWDMRERDQFMIVVS